MSRVGKQPVPYATGVKVQVADRTVKVEGPKAKLELTCHANIRVEHDEKAKVIRVSRPDDERLVQDDETAHEGPLAHGCRVHTRVEPLGRREEAEAAYTAAKEQGKVAGLLNQERPNIFTQHVANIMPGQQIRVVISYVETLKYEDGSYEWSFPMVVAPRYVPAASADANPTNAPVETRAGYDISLEIDLDAGVPIVAINSESHETEVQQHHRVAEDAIQHTASVPPR